MVRDRRHFVLSGLGESKGFKPKGGGSSKHPRDVADRVGYAQQLLSLLDHLPDIRGEARPGLYLSVEGRAGEIMVTKSLDTSGLKLLTVTPPNPAGREVGAVAVFATEQGLANLRKKIEAFATEDHPRWKRPLNADLVQSIGSIVEASLRTLWRSPQEKFPLGFGVKSWEVWLDKSGADEFIERAAELGVVFSPDRLEFPDDVVVLAHASHHELAAVVKKLGVVNALAAPSTTTALFDAMPAAEQVEWVDSLARLTSFNGTADGNYLTLLDTGVSLAHPLIRPALSRDDRHAAKLEWGLDDTQGHGTQLAGLALYGDLSSALQSSVPMMINYRLESVKIVPDAGENDYELLGAITVQAINAVEAAAQRQRTFAMASTTHEDTPHDGAPTSWSSALDQLTSGASGDVKHRRLMVVSAGNSDQQRFMHADYLRICDDAENEVEAPAQAWNAIAVGAYTAKAVVSSHPNLRPVAQAGDLSPSSRTASWSERWPIKPDVVLEGGNWVHMPAPPPLRTADLLLLTTDNSYPQRAFSLAHDTSAATALAAREITQLWADYPDLWPETIRALYVGSARWTPRMRSHLPDVPIPPKGAYERLFQRYGYGVPDVVRARRSASNALTLIVQDEITPYTQALKGRQVHGHKEMRVFELPWPVEALRALGARPVRLRVSLSSFIIPNPAEAARGSRYRYASHNLRFRLNRPDEKIGAFVTRISKVVEPSEDEPTDIEDDGWSYGSNRRDVGSLHIDELVCPASDLALRNLLAVHPVTGWWKSKSTPAPDKLKARFALVVEIDAGELEIDLYTEVATAIGLRNLVQVSG